MTRIEATKVLASAFQTLSESDQNQFMSICNTLLQVNYIVNRQSDYGVYDFINQHVEAFQAYFLLSGFKLMINPEHRLAAIVNEEGMNCMKLKKFETVIILALRMLYHRKMGKISLASQVEIDVRELHEEIARVGYAPEDNRVTKTELLPTLALFRRYNLINYIARDFNDDSRLIIYPSITIAVGYESIIEANDKFLSLSKGGDIDDNEEIDENQDDQLDVL